MPVAMRTLVLLTLPGALLAQGCSVEVHRHDAGVAPCMDVTPCKARCSDAGTCAGPRDCGAGSCGDLCGPCDAAACPKPKVCRDCGAGSCPPPGPCKDLSTKKCPPPKPCADQGTCADAAACPGCDKGVSCADLGCCPDAIHWRTLVDDTFADFEQGKLSEAGAKIYVSARGNVQLLDRLDVDGDGLLDLVLSQRAPSVARVFWGQLDSKGKYLFNPLKTTITLSTIGGSGNALADLRDTSFVDLVSANRGPGTKQTNVNSYIYWGTTTGHSSASRGELPGLGANAVSVADLDRDGYLDLVLANVEGSTIGPYNVNSYIYWGAKAGFKVGSRSELPTRGAMAASVGDLNGDQLLDIVFSSYYDDNSSKKLKGDTNSLIYYNAGKRKFPLSKRSELPTFYAVGNALADLDADGNLDVVFANHGPPNATPENSYIYWGSSSGPVTAKRTELSTLSAMEVSVADLDADGHLDIVFANENDGSGPSYNINSYIYHGSGKRAFPVKQRKELPTRRAHGCLVADFNGDGFLDIAFANYSVGATENSYVYWGAASGVDWTRRTSLTTQGATISTTTDPGALYDRGPSQSFTSRQLDANVKSPVWGLLSVKAQVPARTSLKLQLRSASAMTALSSAPWRGLSATVPYYSITQKSFVAPVNVAHAGHRYMQYRVVFTSDHGNTPVLDRVSLLYR